MILPTPGPWRWTQPNKNYDEWRLGTPSEEVLRVYESHGGGQMPNEADAALIAAAPRMYEALQEISKRLAGVGGADWPEAQNIMHAVACARAILIDIEGNKS